MTTETEDDLQSVLAVVINTDGNVRQIRQLTGLDDERARAALRELDRRDITRPLGGGYWKAYQRECARCSRPPVGGAAIMIDGETLRWFCEDCWKQEAEEVRKLVDPDQEGGE
jgi:hypothetical protein